MAKTVILGPDAKVDIGDPTFGVVPCRVLSGKITDAVKEAQETTDTDTENGGQEFFSDTFSRALIDLEIQLDNSEDDTAPTVEMFTTPLLLTPGGSIPITIWPEGRSTGDPDEPDENSQWIFRRVLLMQGTHGFVVRGSTPQGAMIIGTTNGYYKRPYEVDLGGSYLPPYAEQLTQIGSRALGRPIGAPPPPI